MLLFRCIFLCFVSCSFFFVFPMRLVAQEKNSTGAFSDCIAVVVNDEVITENDLNQRALLLKRILREQGQEISSEKEIRNGIVESLIVELLQREQVVASGLFVSDLEFEKIVEALARDRNLTVAQLKKNLELDGIWWETFKDYIKIDVANSRFRSREFGSQLSVGFDEIQDHIDSNPSAFSNLLTPERVHEEAKQQLMHQKFTKKVLSYLSELRAQSYVEYKTN